ncbi:MAG: rane protein, partial [Mycobacterium sp.]|nr:rane protein [Mycobacterium sp.]
PVDQAEAPSESEATDADGDEKDDAPVPAVLEEPSETSEAVELTETTEVNEVGDPANAGEADDDKADNDVETAGKLRNRRPSGKSLFRRSRGGVALED